MLFTISLPLPAFSCSAILCTCFLSFLHFRCLSSALVLFSFSCSMLIFCNLVSCLKILMFSVFITFFLFNAMASNILSFAKSSPGASKQNQKVTFSRKCQNFNHDSIYFNHNSVQEVSF